MTTKKTPMTDAPTQEEEKIVKLWGDCEEQFENLESQLNQFTKTSAIQGNQPVIFYIGGLQAIKATLLLLRNDMSAPATATTRLSFEHLFCAAACNTDPDYFAQLERYDYRGVERWEKRLIECSLLPQKSRASDSENFRKDDEKNNDKYKPSDSDIKNLSQIATKGNLLHLYEHQYKFLSKTGAHANTLASMMMLAVHESGLSVFYQRIELLRVLKKGLDEWKRQWKLFTDQVKPQPLVHVS